MIARRTAVGLLATLLALGGVAGCSGDAEAPVPAALPSAVTTTPAAPVSTAAGIPAVGAPIVPTEASTTKSRAPRTSRSRTTTRSPSRTATPTRRTVTVPDDDFGRTLFRCLESGRSYDECVD